MTTMGFGQYYDVDPGDRIGKALLGFGATILELRQMYDYMRLREREYEDAMKRHTQEMAYRRSALESELYRSGIRVRLDDNLRLQGEPEFFETPAARAGREEATFQRSVRELELRRQGIEAEFTPEGKLAGPPRIEKPAAPLLETIREITRLRDLHRSLRSELLTLETLHPPDEPARRREIEREQREILEDIDRLRKLTEHSEGEEGVRITLDRPTAEAAIARAREALREARARGEEKGVAYRKAIEAMRSVSGVSIEDAREILDYLTEEEEEAK